MTSPPDYSDRPRVEEKGKRRSLKSGCSNHESDILLVGHEFYSQDVTRLTVTSPLRRETSSSTEVRLLHFIEELHLMHTEPAVIAERGARDAHPTRPLAAVSGAVEVFAIELPRLRIQ